MTDSSNRIERIEALLESASRRIDSNAKAIAANSTQIAEVDRTLAEAAGRTLRAVDELRETVEEDRVNFREFMTTTQSTLQSINAAIERQDRTLDYLLRHNSNGDLPQQ